MSGPSPSQDRPARPADVDEICGALPETWFGTTWGDVPTWLVLHGLEGGERRGRGFVMYRRPSATAIDPLSGEPFTDLLVVRTPSAVEKQELVDAPGPFFTVPHFDRTNAVLVSLSRLSEITRAELAEVIADAWRSCASPALRRAQDDG